MAAKMSLDDDVLPDDVPVVAPDVAPAVPDRAALSSSADTEPSPLVSRLEKVLAADWVASCDPPP